MTRCLNAWPWTLLLIAGVGCDRTPTRAPAQTRTLTVFAAVSLTEAFQEIGGLFSRLHPDARVEFNFAGSQQLRGQIEYGAAADVFAAADGEELAKAVAAGLVTADSTCTFAGNRLAIILPHDNPAGLHALADLARPGIRIDIADPAVPAGRYTQRMLDALRSDARYGPTFVDGFRANVRSRGESVRAVVAKVRLGEMDAGIVYASDAHGQAANLLTLTIPDSVNQVAEYRAGVVTRGSEPAVARDFLAFLLTDTARAALLRHGFQPPPQGS